MKKTIIIITIILAIAAIGIGVYFAWQKSNEVLVPPTAGEKPFIDNQKFATTAGIQNSASGIENQMPIVRVLSDKPIFDYWVWSVPVPAGIASSSSTASSTAPVSGINIFYLDKQGKIYRITLSDQKNTAVFPEEKPNLQSVKASPDGKTILIKYGDAANPAVMVFNAESKIYQILQGAVAADFSPDSKQVAYLDNAAPANLMIKDLVGVKQQTVKLISINIKDIDLSWAASSTIFLISKPSSKYEGQIWSLNTKTKSLSLIASGNGLMVSWSKNAKIGMEFSVNNNRSTNSNFIDSKGSVLARLDFSTLPVKCAFDDPKVPTSTVATKAGVSKIATSTAPRSPSPYAGMSLYCALPQSYNTSLAPVLPDDYLKRAVYFNDFIYKIGLDDNSFTLLHADSNNPIDAYDLKVSGSKLFFINRYDDRLYSLELPGS